MKNLVAARGEINRRTGPAGGFPCEAYINPTEYARWDPNIFLAYDIPPMEYLQQEFVYEFSYEPEPTVPINVKGRIVQCGTIANRIIERALARKISRSIDQYLSDQSWAFRAKRSPQMAVLEVKKTIRRGFHWALKVDVQDFFGSTNRDVMEKQLRATFLDQKLCEMILRANSPLSDHRRWVELSERTEGLPQGNSLSPILSNIYLNWFDQECADLAYQRYADDILVLGRSQREVTVAKKRIERLLAILGLRLNAKKTEIRDLHRQPLVFLGYQHQGGNPRPPFKAVRNLQRQLRARGHEAYKVTLMKGFVNRYRIGAVRKLFRRIDRELRRYYPVGATLTGILCQ
jgi:hypothetical protein